MLDWLGRALDLPKHFLFTESYGRGGGCTHPSSGEAVFSVLAAARFAALRKLGCFKYSNSTSLDDEVHPAAEIHKFVCYASAEANSAVEKAANAALIELKILAPDGHSKIYGDVLETAIQEDIKTGRIPILFIGTAGSSGSAAFDDFASCGSVCQKYNLWFHVDAGYAGGAFILPDSRSSINGLELADSIHINPSELLLGSVDCCCLYVREVGLYKQPFTIDAAYLLKGAEDCDASEIDYRHYGISLSRRMRSVQLYMLFRAYGVRGLQSHVRNIICLADAFESLIRTDDRFVVTHPASVGVLCFRQKA